MEVSRKGEAMRLIDADALIAELEVMPIDIGFEDIDRALEVVKEQPEAIVRCRDCKFQNKGSNEVDAWNLCNFRSWLYIPISDYCFCNFGERRTDGNS